MKKMEIFENEELDDIPDLFDILKEDRKKKA